MSKITDWLAGNILNPIIIAILGVLVIFYIFFCHFCEAAIEVWSFITEDWNLRD